MPSPPSPSNKQSGQSPNEQSEQSKGEQRLAPIAQKLSHKPYKLFGFLVGGFGDGAHTL
ncbi:hypothetical protein [Helicobacter canis]|uniref:hypothetical protein n=1 Tax=Helicobacter canis TaxID=29419 RepID=UPI002941E075|nr:hypothetical protein [Helicobacter canis]